MKPEHLPQDADGDAIRRVVSHGSDLSREMLIDFAVAVPHQAAGLKIADIVSKRGYGADVSFDDEDEAWTCYCSKMMLLTYDSVVAVQRELAEISKPFDAFPDGWGTFGNAEENA